MTKSDAQRAEAWLLFEIPRHPTPTEIQLRRARFQNVAERGLVLDEIGAARVAKSINTGLRRLRDKGYAEKGWKNGRPKNRGSGWRLTATGMAELERIELKAADKRPNPGDG